MNINFKPLEWHMQNNDGTLFAEPYGLEKAYYIYPANTENNEEDLVELVFIDKEGRYDDEASSFHETIQEAQKHAQHHYVNILERHIAK